MKIINKLIIGMCAWALASPASQSLNWREYQQFSQCATQLEHQDKWRQINWMTDFDAAQKRATAEHKPILVFLVVSHKGDKNATDC